MSREHDDHFNSLTLTLLSEPERQQLIKSLKRYQKNKDVARFALTVRDICCAAETATLLEYVRGYVPRSDKSQFDKLTGFQGREHVTSVMANSKPNFFGRITTPPTTATSSTAERLVTIYGSRGETMGFSVRGGSEYGLGIYVSNVKPGTPASEAGLRAGDHIVTANGIDFHCVANSSAVKVLSSSALLNLIILRVGKIPEWKVARERVLWYDVSLCRIVSRPPMSEAKLAGSGQRNVIVDRKLVITITKETDFIGLNIRGGKEYGIGVYVSRVDPGGLARQVGLTAGDQIVRVNDTDCTSVTHSDAVDSLRASVHLIITTRSVGKYPVFKELYAEYTWSDASSLSTTTSGVILRSRIVTAPGDNASGKYSHRTQTRESSIDITPSSLLRADSDNIISSSYLEDTIDELDDSSEAEAESQVYPGDNDIMFRKSYEDSWQEIDNISENYAPVDTLTKSWQPDQVDSLGHYRQDSDNTDDVLDYTSFLEHTSLKDQHETNAKKQQMETRRNSNAVFATVIEEKVTSFSTRPRASTNSDSDVFHPDSHVYSQVQDLTGKGRSSQARSSISSSSQSSPIYATIDKKSSNTWKEPPKSPDVLQSNGIYGGGSHSDLSSHAGETQITDVIESQIERLEARKSHLGSWEITRVTEGSVSSKGSSTTSYESHDRTRNGTWTSIKKKLKGSLRIASPGHKKRSSMPDVGAYARNGTSSTSGSLKKGVFERSFGSQILNTQNPDRYNLMGVLEDHARVLLSQDEYNAVLRHIHNYQESKDLERLVELLLAILDKREKKLLLVDVRNVIAPNHIASYDTLVAHCNIEGYDKWVTKFNDAEESAQMDAARSKSQVNSHNKSKTNDVGAHQRNSSASYTAPLGKDFSNLPGSLEVVLLETDDVGSRKMPVVGNGEEIVYISKHKTILGLDICGGRNDQKDQSIRVKQIIGEGAASDDKRLQPGVQITRVDGKSLEGLSCEEAKSMLQIAFSTKAPVNLGIHIKRADHT